jgi:hypothetical protein
MTTFRVIKRPNPNNANGMKKGWLLVATLPDGVEWVKFYHYKGSALACRGDFTVDQIPFLFERRDRYEGTRQDE